jgi:hypothetical protein
VKRLRALNANQLNKHYSRLVKLTDAEMVPVLVRSNRHLIRHIGPCTSLSYVQARLAADAQYQALHANNCKPDGTSDHCLSEFGTLSSSSGKKEGTLSAVAFGISARNEAAGSSELRVHHSAASG